VVNGLTFGSLLALSAVGLSLIFGILDVPNFAQGEFATLAGFTTAGAMGAGLTLLPSAALGVAVSGIAGVVVERLVISRFYDREDFLLLTFFATVGLVIISENTLQKLAGYQQIPAPDFGSVALAGSQLGYLRIGSGVLAAILLAGLYWFTRRTYAGLAMRSVSDDREGAEMVGVDPQRTFTLTFALGALLSGVTGVLYGMLFTLYPSLGVRLTAFAFTIVVVGGVGSFPGVVIASLLIGLIESFTATFIGTQYRFFAVFVVLFVVLSVRPQGLFGGDYERY
jgi:branched-chain amino acid transport system permease protein